jgi:hypothetical protein
METQKTLKTKAILGKKVQCWQYHNT